MSARQVVKSVSDVYDQTFRDMPIEDLIDPKSKSFTLLSPFNDSAPIADAVVLRALFLQKSLPKLDRCNEQVVDLLLGSETSITFGPQVLSYQKLDGRRCSHALLLSVDPLDVSKMHLSCLPVVDDQKIASEPLCLKSNSYGMLKFDYQLLTNLIKQTPGKVVAFLPLMTDTPCLSELAEFQSTREHLAAIGLEVLISPAQINFLNKNTPTISFYQGISKYIQIGAEREGHVIKNFQEVVQKFAEEIRKNTAIRKSYNDTYPRFMQELLAMETKLAIEFFANQNKTKNILGSLLSFGKVNSTDRLQQRQITEFADSLKNIRQTILKLNLPIPATLAEYSRRIAFTLAQHLSKEFSNHGFFSKAEFSTHEAPVRIVTKKYRDDTSTFLAKEISGVSFEASAIQQNNLSQELTEQLNALGIRNSIHTSKLSDMSDFTTLLDQPRGTIQLYLGELRPWLTSYQGFAFNSVLSKAESQSALFTIEQMKSVVESVTETWDKRQTDRNIKGSKLTQALEERLRLQIEALNSLQLNTSIEPYGLAYVAAIAKMIAKQGTNPSLEKSIPVLEEARQLTQLFIKHLINSGILVPVYFLSEDGARLDALPVKVGSTLAEVFQRRMIKDGGRSGAVEWYPQTLTELAQIFWHEFPDHPEIFTAAARAVQLGMKLVEIFPTTSIKELFSDKQLVIEAAEKIGSENIGECIITSEARSRLGISNDNRPLNTIEDVNVVKKCIRTTNEFLLKHSALIRHLKLNESLSAMRELSNYTVRAVTHEHLDTSAHVAQEIVEQGVLAVNQLQKSINPLLRLHDKEYRKKLGSLSLSRTQLTQLSTRCAELCAELASSRANLKTVGVIEIINLALSSDEPLPTKNELQALSDVEPPASEIDKSVTDLLPTTESLQISGEILTDNISSDNSEQQSDSCSAAEAIEAQESTLPGIEQPLESTFEDSVVTEPVQHSDEAQIESRTNSILEQPANLEPLLEKIQSLPERDSLDSPHFSQPEREVSTEELETIIERELEDLWNIDGGIGEEFIKLEELGSNITERDFKELYRRFKIALNDTFIGIVIERKGGEFAPCYYNDGVLELNADRIQELTPHYLNMLEVPTIDPTAQPPA